MINQKISKVEKRIEEIIKNSQRNEKIYSAILYHFSAGGKRIRPLLSLIISDIVDYGKTEEEEYNLITSASCVELLHGASLMLDDVIDNSDTRRGKPSVNALFGNKIAVISASFLLGVMSDELAKIGNLELVRTFSHTAKVMAEGEVIELNLMINNISLNTIYREQLEKLYFDVIDKKTASLFSLSSSIPLILKGNSTELKHVFSDFGRYFGTIFQIRDDILDFISDKTGKPKMNDVKEGKITLPVILSDNFHKIVEIMKEEKNLSDGALDLIQGLVISGGGIERAEEQLNKIYEKTLSIFRSIDVPENKKQNLLELLELSKERLT
ncbi:Octaprenyl diphosphate synthase [bacterium HR19]|nr:Octaprenyl diphosphate synthase [bacterium HR19]